MRIERKTLTLIIASLCGAGSSAVALGQDPSLTSPVSSVGRIGDGGAGGRVPPAAMPVDSRPVAFGGSGAVGGGAAAPTFYDPTLHEASYRQPAFSEMSYDVSGMESNACSTCVASGGAVSSGTPSSNGWLEVESLLWWGKGIQGIPLVTQGTPLTAVPNQVVSGGLNNPTGTGLQPGMRISTGLWLDECQTYGVGGRVWGLFSGSSTQTFADPNRSSAVPYFNTAAGLPFLYNVNDEDGVNGSNLGSIQVKSDIDLVATELYGRTLIAKSGTSRVDLLTGYTFVRLDSELALRTRVVDGITGNPIQNGTISTTQDIFGTKNQFHGGHIGLSHELTTGRFSFSALGKIALGNIQQSSNASGSFDITNTNTPAAGPRGLFAQSSNSLTQKRNQFTFMPEAGAKVKYQLGQAQFGVGYTMMILPSVAMAASQMDPNIDIVGAVLNNPILSPAPKFTTETYFLHGLDLGVTFQF